MVGLSVEVVASDLGFPVSIKPVPGRDAFVVVAKAGRIQLWQDGGMTTWLGIGGLVRDRGEQGLLDMEFAGGFEESGRFFVHYSDRRGDTVLAEYRESEEGVDPGAGIILYSLEQPAANHNGGSLVLAPDGALFLALGDGGGAGDRYGNGQRPDTALGAILRFDVSTPGVAVAADGNPYPDGPVPEVWATGLRNPWRMAIDGATMYIADVGQDRYEEINLVPWNRPGLNFGWPITEGLHCFDPATGCLTEGITLPVVEVAHGDEGTCSITGGLVYRGDAIPELVGHYLFSDFCGGYLRSLDPAGDVHTWTELLGGSLGNVTGFGTDWDGEVLIATADGVVRRLIPVR